MNPAAIEELRKSIPGLERTIGRGDARHLGEALSLLEGGTPQGVTLARNAYEYLHSVAETEGSGTGRGAASTKAASLLYKEIYT